MDNLEKIEQADANKARSWNSSGIETKIYKCHKFDCDFETTELLEKCPECGWNLLDPQAVRVLGIALAFLGGILAIGGGALIILVSTRMPQQGNKQFVVYGLLIVLTVLGLGIFLAGLSQAVTRRKNFKLMAIAIVLVFLLGVTAMFVRLFD